MKKSLALIAVAALGLAACGGDDDGAADPTDTTDSTVSVSGAWARTSPMSASVGAVYLVLESSVDDQLVEASVDPGVAARTEIHETVMAGDMNGDMDGDEMDGDETTGEMDGDMDGDEMDGDMDGDEMDGAMTMRQITALELPAGERVELRPGGYHIMLLELAEPLVVGESFDLTLGFASAESQTVSVEIRDEAP